MPIVNFTDSTATCSYRRKSTILDLNFVKKEIPVIVEEPESPRKSTILADLNLLDRKDPKKRKNTGQIIQAQLKFSPACPMFKVLDLFDKNYKSARRAVLFSETTSPSSASNDDPSLATLQKVCTELLSIFPDTIHEPL